MTAEELLAFEQRVQRKAEDHLNACLEAMEILDADVDAEVENPAYGPFDGCNTCIVREVLSVCWEEMLAEARKRGHRSTMIERVGKPWQWIYIATFILILVLPTVPALIAGAAGLTLGTWRLFADE